MKVEDIKTGHTYKVKVAKDTVTATVRNITETDRNNLEGTRVRTFHSYEIVTVPSGRVYSGIGPTAFIEEIIKKPKKDDLVRIVSGVVVSSLDASILYRVKTVGPKNCVVASGKKDHRIPLCDVRVVEPEGEKSPDPIVSRKTSSTRNTIPSPTGSSTTPVPQVPTTDDWLNDKSPEWCEAALVAGYDSDNPPPIGWEPGTSLGEEGVPSQSTLSRVSEWGRSDLTRIANCADGDDPLNANAQAELMQIAVDSGIRVKDVYAADSWSIVADMIRERQRVVRKNRIICDPPNYVSPGDDEPTPLVKGPLGHNGGTGTHPSPQKNGKPTLSERLGRSRTHADDSPHLIVEARAGTGKTTTLVEGLKPLVGMESTLIPSPQQRAVWDAMALSKGKAKSFCMVAFNKSIATELQTRVPPGVVAMTMHSMGFGAIKNAFGRNIKVESGRVGNILSELLERDIRELRKDERTFAIMKAVEDLVGLCKMSLVGLHVDYEPDGWTEELDRLASHYEVEITDSQKEQVYVLVPQVLERCKDVRRDNEIDFNDMIWLPVVLDLAATKYDVLLVDEAQDLNRCQQALAKKAGHRLILCGDPRQAIYGFAGADAESMPRMYKELSGAEWNRVDVNAQTLNPGRGCQLLPLTVTRRCGKAIVREAQKLVPDFEAFDTNPEGKVTRLPFSDKNSKLTPEEKKLNPPDDYTKHVLDGDFILCRVNAPLVSQCFRFLKEGRRAHIQGRDIGQGLVKLMKKFNAGDVPDLVKSLSDWYYGEQKKENAKRNPSESKLIALGDKYDCLIAFTENMGTVEDVVKKIESVFQDEDVTKPRTGIRLSSIHRAKGLESKRVFLLQPEGCQCPHPMAKSKWQIEQEYNLLYVATTRAIEELILVS